MTEVAAMIEQLIHERGQTSLLLDSSV